MGKSPFRPFPQPPLQTPSIAVDRLGRVIEEGHLLYFHTADPLALEVVDVRKVLNPTAPNGMMQIRVRAEFAVHVMPAEPSRQLTIIGKTQTRLDADAKNNGQPTPMGLVVTDGDTPSEVGPTSAGKCVQCGDEANEEEIGKTCESCGTGIYARV